MAEENLAQNLATTLLDDLIESVVKKDTDADCSTAAAQEILLDIIDKVTNLKPSLPPATTTTVSEQAKSPQTQPDSPKRQNGKRKAAKPSRHPPPTKALKLSPSLQAALAAKGISLSSVVHARKIRSAPLKKPNTPKSSIIFVPPKSQPTPTPAPNAAIKLTSPTTLMTRVTTRAMKSMGPIDIEGVPIGRKLPADVLRGPLVRAALIGLVCSLCEPFKVLSTRPELIEHLQVVHGGELGLKKVQYRCNICGKCYSSQVYLLTHRRECGKVKKLPQSTRPLLKCDPCKRCFTTAAAFAVHQKTHQQRNTGELTCEKCQVGFGSVSQLVRHVFEHDVTTGEKMGAIGSVLGSRGVSLTMPPPCFQCPACLRNFTIRQVYQRHLGLVRQARLLADPEQCPECEFKTPFVCLMGVHLDSHRFAKERKTLACRKCRTEFRTENALVRHELEHEGKLNAPCKRCGGYFRSIPELNRHARLCVDEEKQAFPCTECKRVFTSLSRLREHEHDIRVYFCDQCGREFRHLAHLTRHVNSKCGTQPWIFCDFCNAGFFTRKSLAAHLRETHTTERMFICQYCSREFLTRLQLTRHETRHNRSKI